MIEEPNVVLFVSTYPPRECGIATFTQDISSAVEKKFYPHLVSKILAMNSNSVNIYNYPKKVIYQLSDFERKNYKKIQKKKTKKNRGEKTRGPPKKKIVLFFLREFFVAFSFKIT